MTRPVCIPLLHRRLSWLWLAAVALAFWPGLQTVLASGGDIRVVRQQQEVLFPGKMGFGLTVESTAEITEMRLYFRPLGGRAWTYDYFEFEPAKRVTAELEVDIVGDSYLPPGARLEFYHEIRDSAGSLLETPPADLEYFDNRFDWEQVRIGPLLLYYHDQSESRVSSVADAVAGPIQTMTELLRIDPDNPVKGVIYSRHRDAQDAFPFQSETISERGVFQGFAFTSYGVFVGAGLDPRLIVHETAHLMLHQSLGPRAGALPAWLDEGFATYMEPDSVSYGSKGLREEGLPLRTMNRVSGTPAQIGIFYMKSGSVVAFLIERWGIETFQQFLDQLRRGRPVNQALISVYGLGVDGLDSLWAAEAQGPRAPNFSPGSPPSPYLYLDVWGFGGLIILVLLFVGARSIYRRFRKAPEAEDDWGDILTPLDDYENYPPAKPSS